MPASGKSTVGKEVARRLGVRFVDSDAVIEQRVGCSIAAFFDRHGEGAFRDLEMETIESIVAAGPAVLSTGGGVVLRERNRELLRERTRCVYLSATFDLLWKRLRRDRRRPLLQAPDAEARLRAMLLERQPLYREVAAVVVESGASSLDRLADEVVQQLNRVRPQTS